MPADDEIAPIHYRMPSPALDFGQYLDLQKHLLKGLGRRGRLRGWGGVLALILLGMIVSTLPAVLGLQSELWLANRTGSSEWLFDTDGVFTVLLSLLLLGMLIGSAWTSLAQMRLLRAIHAESSGLFAAHEVLFGERGVLWRNDQRATLLPWASFTRLVRGHGQWLLIADHASAIWMPDAALADGPGEASVLDLIARHTGLKPSDKDLARRRA